MDCILPNREITFLADYCYFNNNIEFRIVSSKAIEKWKHVQSFQLNQLINGKFKFSQECREILLLKYDLWSRLIAETENLCIEVSNQYKVVDEEFLKMFFILINKTMNEYKNVMTNTHKEKFNQKCGDIWLKIHKDPEKYLLKIINDMSGYSLINFFVIFVDTITEIMQYTLMEIHELNSFFNYKETSEITKNSMPFIVITDFSEKVFDSLGVNIILNRIKIYKKISNIKEIYLKNYTDKLISSILINEIQNLGIKINFPFSIAK